MNRTRIVAGNWKMNKTPSEALALVEELKPLVANDAQAWQQLKQELDIRTSSGVTSWLAAPANPATRAQWNGSPVCKAIASHARRTVALYLITSEQQYDALLDYQMTHTKNKDL